MASKQGNQAPPEGRMSWARVPGQIDELVMPEEGEVFRRTITAELFEDGSTRVAVAGRMVYGSQGKTTSANIEADLENDPDRDALVEILLRIQERYSRQLRRRLNRDSVMALGAAIREGEEKEEDN